jgi:hypothetical protein
MDKHGNWHEVSEEAQQALEKKIDEINARYETESKAMCYLEIGEIVIIHGEKFRVRKVTKKDVILRSVRHGGAL